MEKKRLRQEELKEKIWEQNQANGFTASSKGRSAAQGIKLLLIRDYLRKHTDKEHPKNAKDIVEYLATQGIKAERKTIYNDILRLQIDLQEPIEYNPKKWGYGWLCGFRKMAKIVSPPDVVADFQNFLDDIYGRYEIE